MTIEEISKTLSDIVSAKEFYVPLITICVVILLSSLSSRVVKKLINKDANNLETKRRNTIVSLIQNILKYLFIIIGLLIILNSWGVNVSGLVTGLGVAGVVGGLALQDALKDIIMGCNIILDNYFVVGDLISYDDFTGEVIEFGLKSTKIKNVDGTVLIVSNREIYKIKNLSQKTASVSIIVPASYDDSESKIAKVLISVCKQVDELDITTGTTEYLGIDELAESSVNYIIRGYCKVNNKVNLKRKMLGLVKAEFDKRNIKIPYKQLEVHNGKGI